MFANAYRRRPSLILLAVFALYAALSMVLFCRSLDWRHDYLGGAGGDAWNAIWSINWWPWAVLHGHDAVDSRFVYAPAGYDLTWATSVPTAAILAYPITLVFGAAASFNALSIAAPALSAFAAFLLLTRSVGCGIAAGLVCGAIFGFSSYEIGQMRGHLNLDLNFPVPLICLMFVERTCGRIGRPAFIGAECALLLAQFGISVEVFASLVCLGLFAWAVFAICAERRRDVVRTGLEMAAALVLVAAAASPWLIHMALSRNRIPDFINLPSVYSTNLLNLVVPTSITAIGGQWFAGLSSHFSGNSSEQGAYIGLPLLLVMLLLAWERGRERPVAALLAVIAGLFLASLGPSLHVGQWDSRIPMPWWPATHLPLLRGAMPARFSLYVALGVSIAAAIWQGSPALARSRAVRLGILVAGFAMLLPNPASIAWGRLPLLPFFEPAHAAAVLGKNANVLVLPYLSSDAGATPAMIWQWQSGMGFRQAGGYFPFVPLSLFRSQFVQHLIHNEPSEAFDNDMTAFVFANGVSFVAAGPGTSKTLLSALHLLHWQERQDGGIDLFEVPPRETLRFASLSGDLWYGWGTWSWMGRSVTLSMQNRPAIVHFSDTILPTPATTITMRDQNGAARTLSIAAHGTADIPVPGNGTFTFSAGATFVPRSSWPNNRDDRHLSFLVSVQPVASAP